jgi:hypothetical protein
MIQQFAKGELVNEVIKNGNLELGEFYERLGEVLYLVHQVKPSSFGHIGSGEGKHSTLAGYIESSIQRCRTYLVDQNDRLFDFIDNESLVESIILDVKTIPKNAPVLCHTDINTTNCIFQPEKELKLCLIDCDNAIACHWSYDIAMLTYSTIIRYYEDEAKLMKYQKYKESLFHSYDQSMSFREFERIESIFHKVICIEKGAYSKNKGYLEKYRFAGMFLKKLLEKFLFLFLNFQQLNCNSITIGSE